MGNVLHVEQSGLMDRVAVLFRKSQTPVQGFANGIAFAVHLRRRETQRGLKMHLVEVSRGGAGKGQDGTL